jgi:hypothetical protein
LYYWCVLILFFLEWTKEFYLVSLTSAFKPSWSVSAIAYTVSFKVLFISSIHVHNPPWESKRDRCV